MSTPGEYSDEKPATKEVQNICEKVRSDAEKCAGQTFTDFTVLSFRLLVVLLVGKHYLCKVRIAVNLCIHIYVLQKVDGTYAFLNCLTGKTVADQLLLF